MTDYIKAYETPTHPYHREARRLEPQLRDETTLTNGVLRWKSSKRVVPSDCAELAQHVGIAISLEACTKARDKETAEFLANYRRTQTAPSAEELSEMRAAFGPGTTVVNIITGRKTRL